MEQLEQGSPEWLEWRRKGIGASEIGAIVGISPYSTPYEVWKNKTGRSGEAKSNFAMQRGTELEPKARALYELFQMEDMEPALAVHPKYDIVRVSLDGMNKDKTKLLEIKCPGVKTHELAMEGIIKEHYLAQMQYQMAATGAKSCTYFSYNEECSEKYVSIEVEEDLNWQGQLVAAAHEFWKHVTDDTQPDLLPQDILELKGDKAEMLVKELLACKEQKQTKAVKEEFAKLKEKFIELAGHPKARCLNVSVSTSAKGALSLRVAKTDATSE